MFKAGQSLARALWAVLYLLGLSPQSGGGAGCVIGQFHPLQTTGCAIF